MVEPLPYKAVQKTGQASADFESIIEDMSVRAKRVLGNLGVKDTDALLRITRDDLIQAWSCGKKTIAEIEELRSKLRPQKEPEVSKEQKDALNFDNAPKVIIDAVLGVLSVRGAHVLEDLGIDSLKAFIDLDRKQLLNCRNCGRKTSDEILRIQAGIDAFALELTNKFRDYSPIQLLSAPCLAGITTDQKNSDKDESVFTDSRYA